VQELHQIIGNTPGRNYNRYISLGDNRTHSTILRVLRVSWGWGGTGIDLMQF